MDKNELKNLIPQGTLIRTKHPKSKWISNVVHKTYDNCLQIELTQDYINNHILVGDEIKCKFSTSDSEYLLECTIQNIDIEKNKLLTMCANKVNKFKNARANNRYDTNMISRISIDRDTQFFGILTTISSSGISVLVKTELPLDCSVYVEVFIDSGNMFGFNGQIVRRMAAETGLEFGIRFIDLDSESSAILNQILEQLKTEDNRLINKYLSSLNS